MVISFDDDDDFRDDDAEDVAGDDRLRVVAVAEFGLALPLAFEFEFFGSGLRLAGLFRVDISERGIVMYCWTPSSLCS